MGIDDLISLLWNTGRSLKLWQYENEPRTARSLPARWEVDNEYHFQALLWVSPSHARKNGARYRYYVSQALIQHRKTEAGSIARVSAPEIEAAVMAARPSLDAIARVAGNLGPAAEDHNLLDEALHHEVPEAISRRHGVVVGAVAHQCGR